MSSDSQLIQVVVGRKRLPLRACLLRGGSEELIDFTYSFWVLLAGSDVTLIDTGFPEAVAAKRGIAFERTAAQALHELDISADDVTTIILSHLHFDHAGGLSAFPRARIYLQAADLAFYTGEFMRFPLCASATERTDVDALLRAKGEGRLELLTGDTHLPSGVELLHIGGHTPGMQAIAIACNDSDRRVVLASDAAHLYANLEKQIPFPVLHDVPTSCVAFERLSALAEAATVVPGHDGAVMDAFPRLDGSAADYAVRLL